MAAVSSITVGYVRVSTLTQVADGDGLQVQRERIESWCAYQGIPLTHLYEDAGVSGFSTDARPGFREAVRKVLSAGSRGILLTYRLDRLGRNAIDVQEVLALLLSENVRVISISDGIDSGAGMGSTMLRLLISILASFAELERDLIRGRLAEGRRRADENNRVYAVEPRYGRKVVDEEEGLLGVDEAEARAIARIRELRAQGHSLRFIAATLDEEGYRPRRAGTWNHVVVGRIAAGTRAAARPMVTKRIERARAEILREDGANDAAARVRQCPPRTA